MRADDVADALCGIGEDIHALLRDVRHRMDVEPDLRWDAIERELISALQDIGHLIDVLEQQAFEEMMAETDVVIADGPRH
jgi:hypothetical protein